VSIYPGVIWSWVIGSDEVDPTNIDEITTNARLDGLRSVLRVYNPAFHRAAFALPTFLQTLLSRLDRDRPPTAADLRAAGHPLPGLLA
jgi:spermidine synthase